MKKLKKSSALLLIVSFLFNNIRIKDDLSLVYEQDGVLHNENSLSSGLRHTLNLLYRFALAQTIFKDDKILLVREKSTQTWSLPGGWNDYDCTTAENCAKEAREEAGRIVKPVKVIAIQDRNHHNKPIRATNITKIFYLCKEISGQFEPNDETDACEYFTLDKLPRLSLGRTTKEQISMCFEANKDPNWKTRFE